MRIERMPDPAPEEAHDSQKEFAELVKRALIEAGDLQTIEGKLKELVERHTETLPSGEKAE